MAATCFLVALLAGAASLLGVFARGTGAFVTVTSVRGDVYDMATTGVYANNAQRVVAEGVGWDVVTLLAAVPALLLAVPLVARGSFRGRLFAAGLLGLAVLTAVLLLRRSRLSYAMAAAFGVTFMAMTTAITAMLLSAWSVEGTLEVVPVAIFGVAALIALGLLVRTYRTPGSGARQRSGVRAIGATG